MFQCPSSSHDDSFEKIKRAKSDSLAVVAEDDHEQSDSNEPSLANSSVSSSSRTGHDVRRQEPLQATLPLHAAQSSLLDMTRDDSHDDTGEISMNVLERHGSHQSPDASLLDDDEEDDDDEVDDGDELLDHEESFGVMERGIANISKSLSGSFCTLGDEVQNSCAKDCTAAISENFRAKKMLYSDRILQKRLMGDFHYLLGSSTQPCCAEKNLFVHCFGLPFSIFRQHDKADVPSRDDKIRNRAGESWRARAYRIKRLREEKMMKESGFVKSFDAVVALKEKPFSKSNSFSHFSHHVNSANRKPKQEVNVEPLGCIIGDCIEPISPMEEEDFELEWKSRQEYMDEHDFCYDSDPGILTQSGEKDDLTNSIVKPNYKYERSKSCEVHETHSPRKKWPKSPRRRRRKMHFDSFDESLDGDNCDLGEAKVSSAAADGIVGNHVSSSFHLERSSRPCPTSIDKDIQSHVQTTLNQSWTLTWHPASNESIDPPKRNEAWSGPSSRPGKHVASSSPRCIQVWFERGNRIRRNDIVEPKLMWRDAYHPDLMSQRKLNKSTTQGPHQICLLSICRIIEAKALDRNKYPFAKKSCSFIVRTSDDVEFVFEAGTQQQRDYVVHMWKLVVARLASQAVVGDGEGMVGEFFVPSSFGVP